MKVGEIYKWKEASYYFELEEYLGNDMWGATMYEHHPNDCPDIYDARTIKGEEIFKHCIKV
jgi:hypothetical protein